MAESGFRPWRDIAMKALKETASRTVPVSAWRLRTMQVTQKGQQDQHDDPVDANPAITRRPDLGDPSDAARDQNDARCETADRTGRRPKTNRPPIFRQRSRSNSAVIEVHRNAARVQARRRVTRGAGTRARRPAVCLPSLKGAYKFFALPASNVKVWPPHCVILKDVNWAQLFSPCSKLPVDANCRSRPASMYQIGLDGARLCNLAADRAVGIDIGVGVLRRVVVLPTTVFGRVRERMTNIRHRPP